MPLLEIRLESRSFKIKFLKVEYMIFSSNDLPLDLPPIIIKDRFQNEFNPLILVIT